MATFEIILRWEKDFLLRLVLLVVLIVAVFQTIVIKQSLKKTGKPLVNSTKLGAHELASSRLCIYVQSHGLDDKRNYTDQRMTNIATWAGPYHKANPHNNISLTFVTDGWVPPSYARIALNTTGLDYWEGDKALWRLFDYFQEANQRRHCDFYALSDSDVYLRPDMIVESLQSLDPNEDFYAGNTDFGGHCAGMEKRGRFAHGALMLFSRKTVLESTPVEKCKRSYWSGYFDVNMMCCLWNHTSIKPVWHGQYVTDNEGEKTRETYAVCPEKERYCTLAVHKLDPMDFSYLIHADLNSLHERASYNCSGLWFRWNSNV